MIRDLLKKYKKILLYILISLLAMLIEMVIGVMAIRVIGVNEVYANTISVLLGSVFHFCFITKKVFLNKVGIKSGIVYVTTFIMGLAIQNGVIYMAYNSLQPALGDMAGYAVSKIMSVAASFAVMYNIRKYLYSKI